MEKRWLELLQPFCILRVEANAEAKQKMGGTWVPIENCPALAPFTRENK
jgi:hypothetical protein